LKIKQGTYGNDITEVQGYVLEVKSL